MIRHARKFSVFAVSVAAITALTVPAASAAPAHSGPHPAYLVTYQGTRTIRDGRDASVFYRQWAHDTIAGKAFPGTIYRLPDWNSTEHSWQRVTVRRLTYRGWWGAFNHHGHRLIKPFRL